MTNGGVWLLLMSLGFWMAAVFFGFVIIRQHDPMNAFFVLISLAAVGTLLAIAVNQGGKT